MSINFGVHITDELQDVRAQMEADETEEEAREAAFHDAGAQQRFDGRTVFREAAPSFLLNREALLRQQLAATTLAYNTLDDDKLVLEIQIDFSGRGSAPTWRARALNTMITARPEPAVDAERVDRWTENQRRADLIWARASAAQRHEIFEYSLLLGSVLYVTYCVNKGVDVNDLIQDRTAPLLAPFVYPRTLAPVFLLIRNHFGHLNMFIHQSVGKLEVLVRSNRLNVNIRSVEHASLDWTPLMFAAILAGNEGIQKFNLLLSVPDIAVNDAVQPDNPLVLAVERGDLPKTVALCRMPLLDKNFVNPDGTTVAMVACIHNSWECLRELLRNVHNGTPVDCYARDNTGKTALMRACINTSANSALALMTMGSRENKVSPNLFYQLSDNLGNTALHYASYANVSDALLQALTNSQVMDTFNNGHMTAMMLAVAYVPPPQLLAANVGTLQGYHNPTSVVNQLVRMFPITLIDPSGTLNRTDPSGNSALMVAIKHNPRVEGDDTSRLQLMHGIRALLSIQGTDLNIQNNHGQSALHLAVMEGNNSIPVIKLLIGDQRCNENLRDVDGDTALMLTCNYGDEEANPEGDPRAGLPEVAMLLIASARTDIGIGNNRNEFPLHNALYIQSRGKRDFAEVIRQMIHRCTPAQIEQLDGDGSTPLKLAIDYKLPQVVRTVSEVHGNTINFDRVFAQGQRIKRKYEDFAAGENPRSEEIRVILKRYKNAQKRASARAA